MEVLCYDDGTEYRGAVVNGRPHGVGQLCLASGVRCTGDFVEGEAHGRAIQVVPNHGVYTGPFRRGRRYGVGTFRFPTGAMHEGKAVISVTGEWADGVFQLRDAKWTYAV